MLNFLINWASCVIWVLLNTYKHHYTDTLLIFTIFVFMSRPRTNYVVFIRSFFIFIFIFNMINRIISWIDLKTFFLKNLYGSFLWMEFNCLKATKPLQRGSLLFSTSSQNFLVLIWSTSERLSGFEHGTPGLGIYRPNH